MLKVKLVFHRDNENVNNIKNTIIVEDQKIYKIDETTSNINNVGLYIIYGLCICAIIYKLI